MAKKKVTRQSNGTIEQTHDHKVADTDTKATALNPQPSMEDHDSSEEKVQSLKSLNALLLKETMEKRHHIESLVQAKDALEAELTRSGSDKTGLLDELSRASDEIIGLKLEMALVMAFVESRLEVMGDSVDGLVKEKNEREDEIRVLRRETCDLMGKLESEREILSRVCEERDSIKSEFDVEKEKAIRFRENVIVLEKKESILEDEIKILKLDNNGLMEEKKNRDELIEQARGERSVLEKALEGKAREIDDLKSEIEGLVRNKKEMEAGKLDKEAKIDELEKKLKDLNEIVEILRKEERVLQEQVIRLEKNCDDEALEKENEMAMQIDALLKQKAIQESELEKLTKEKILVEKQMETALVDISEKEKLIDLLSKEKNELEERIVTKETELIDLKREIDDQKLLTAMLLKDYSDETKKNEKLSGEVSQLKDTLSQVELEKDSAGKALDEERRNRVDLKSKVSELENTIKITVEELEKIKSGRESLVRKNKELEIESNALKDDKGILEKDLGSVRKAVDVLKAELESARVNESRCLAMLKSTASLLLQSHNTKDGFTPEKESESYAVELEAIKNAFRNKEEIVEEMRKKVETMKHSMEEAHKKKSLWTIISSATTIFAAASVAYAARIR